MRKKKVFKKMNLLVAKKTTLDPIQFLINIIEQLNPFAKKE